MPPRLLSAAASVAARRSTSLIAVRHNTSTPYPFTKPSPDPQRPPKPDKEAFKAAAASSDTPYPFTSPTQKAPIAPTASRPVARPGPEQDESVIVSREAPEDESHQGLDWNSAADYRTSTFSPVPARVMDGSEDGDNVAAAVLSGAPTELQARTVRIYKPAKTATQSGDWTSHHWRMDWDILHKGHRWENPLMGWQSSGDFMQGTKLNFSSKEDAIRFAEKQGYEYYVQEPHSRKFQSKAYANQFVHSYGTLKQVRTK